MTAICGGAASQSKPGFNNTVVVTSAAIEGALILLGLEPLAAVLGPVLAGETYDLTTFCTVDPPADPGLTAADILSVTNWTDPTVSIPAIAKVQQWFKSWYWYQVCQCSTVSTPAAPNPSNPGAISTNPGLPSSGSAKPCWSVTQTVTVPSMPNGAYLWDTCGFADCSQKINPPALGLINPPFAAAIPGGQENYYFTASFDPTAPLGSLGGSIFVYDSGGTNHGSDTFGTNTRGTTDSGNNIPTGGPNYYWAFGFQNTDSHPHWINYTFYFYCSGQTATNPESPCCPPDPLLETKLNQILGLVQSIYEGLPTPIHSYALGAVHSGLSGANNFAVAPTTVALKVQLTTIPNWIGEIVADPITYFNAGFVTAETTEGLFTGTRVTYSTQIIVLPTLTTKAHYWFSPGVVATITELTPGP